MNESKLNVTIKGITPLLMNRPDMLDITDKAKKKKSGEDKLTKQFKEKQYLTSEGKLYTPATHIRGALIQAGKQIKVKGKGKATYSKIIGYAVMVEPEAIIHKNQKLERHVVLGVNPNTRGRVAICRPMLKEWELDFQITFDSEEIPIEVIEEALNTAGKTVGIGDWRPATKGIYGRFITTKLKEVS